MALKPPLLFIAPTMPAPTGNGLAMRAGVFLEALAPDHAVSLVVVPVASATPRPAVTPFVARRTARTMVLPLEGLVDPLFALLSRVKDPAGRTAALARYPHPFLSRFSSPAAVSAVAGAFPGVRFKAVHVTRGYLAPFAEPYLTGRYPGGGPRVVLDLDEPDSDALDSVGEIRRRHGDSVGAAHDTSEAAKHAALERAWLPRFDCVLVASPADWTRMLARCPEARIEVLPNAVRVPRRQDRRPRRPTCDVLFVGSLGYFPNEDAARFFCREVLPRLDATVGHPVRVCLVGSRPGPAVRALEAIPGVRVHGDVPAVAPYYARARLAVVPVRAGGGTRIKVLEAFAHRVPVVATAAGAQGLNVADGRHLLVADEADALALACLRLMRNPRLVHRLQAEAYSLVRTRYAFPVVSGAIRRLYRAMTPAP